MGQSPLTAHIRQRSLTVAINSFADIASAAAITSALIVSCSLTGCGLAEAELPPVPKNSNSAPALSVPGDSPLKASS